ncbi:helix-turn-helix domain-containing protein [Harryflintia acetispora]|nr:S24 family peptidase [Provencibacterium massiliense]RGB66752.1 helix-turn-helix domain-containing protein [Harryflintia acetispora]
MIRARQVKAMELQDLIRTRRTQLGKTLEEIGKAVGVSKATVQRWESGEIKNLRRDRIARLAAALEVTSESIVMDQPTESVSHTGIKIPVLGYVRAGIPIEAVQEILDYEEITPEMAAQGEHFALQVTGNSMEPRFQEGDVVIVRRQPDVDDGNIAVVLVDGNDATVKTVRKHKNGISLVAMNPSYTPMFFTNDEILELPVSIIGKVVELRGKF